MRGGGDAVRKCEKEMVGSWESWGKIIERFASTAKKKKL